MKKDTFCVRSTGQLPATVGNVSGYTYTLSGFRFGVTRQNYLGIDCGKWCAVELTTGLPVLARSTMKSAVLDLLEKLRNEQFKSFLQDVIRGGTDNNHGLEPRYTVWSAR